MARESFKPIRGNAMQQLPPSADDLPEQVIVDLDGKDGNFVVVDDTPEEDRGRPTEVDPSLAEQESDLRGLSKNVQKRIDRIRFETHTERRAREAAERERDAAVQLARDQQSELEQLRKSSATGATALAASMKAERETKLADAQRRLTQAHADGDPAAIAQATSDIAGAQAELVQIAARTPAARTADPAPVAQAQPQQQRQQPNLAPNVQSWIERNRSWFQKPGYETRTAKALSIHYDIVSRHISPASEQYAQELDKGLKAVYPDHVSYHSTSDNGADPGERTTPRRTNVVTEGGREDSVNADPSSRKVVLTQSEVSLANRLRVPLEKYAEQKRLRLLAEKGGAQ